jgi:hypothetical protein
MVGRLGVTREPKPINSPSVYRIPVSHEIAARVVRLAVTVTFVGEQRGNGFGATATAVYVPGRTRRL